MECNEDGFNLENLTAICNIGKSSKAGAQGYIGEKGIGFKSVFMAAYKVHVESGDFSFFFQHRAGDSGMGMITPVWQDPEGDLADRLTRITLFLRDDGNPDVLEKRRQTIRQQFRDIHDSILLFMKNMQRINVIFYADGDEELKITYSIDRQTNTRVVVNKSTYEDGKDHECVRQHYHTTRHVATNLAENENRTYSDLERHSKAYSRSEVVLAFPLEGDSPKLENQSIFAFLPVRQMGFKVRGRKRL
jgi:HSP90 family molecular chaperone